MSFREIHKIPFRRNITTNVNHYREHRSDLVLDFKERCGYCNDIHLYRNTSFEIDHFIPRKKNKVPFLTIKSDKDYSNLIYACKSCNNAKSNKWPSNDQNITIINDEGFIDPCDQKYDNQFIRLSNGQITPITTIGKWMYKELKLHKPQHEIIFNVEQLDIIINKLEPQVATLTNIVIAKQIIDLLLKYRKYIQQLGSI